MFFVNVVSMRIPITIFICVSTSVAQSTGSNSSILESKIELGFPMDTNFNLLYTGFLILRNGNAKVATITFINERNCITTKRWGMAVRNDMQDYLAQTPACPEEESYDILSVLCPEEDDYVAAFYSIIKLKRYLKNARNYIQFVNTRVSSFEMGRMYYAGGRERHPDSFDLRYLKIELKSFRVCKNILRKKFKRILHNLACATATNGVFNDFDIGTPLFMSNNELLGVAVSLRGSAAIFALVYNDVQSIYAFRDYEVDPSGGEGGGEAAGELRNACSDPRSGVVSPHLPDMSNMDPGHMGTQYLPDMGHIDPGQMGTPYLPHMGHMDPGHISTPYLPDMSHIDSGHMGTPYLPNMSHMDPGQMGTPHLPYMSHMNPGQMGTSHLPYMSQMNPGYMNTPDLSEIGHMDLSNIGPHYHSDIVHHFPGYTNSQCTPGTDNLMSIFRPSRPINPGREQSSQAHQSYDGSHSVHPLRTTFENSNVQEDTPVPDSSRFTGVRTSRNSRKRGNRPKK